MKIINYVFATLYRIWFYILVTVPIIILFPFLFISILKESWYPYFFKLARFWAMLIIFGMGFYPIIKRETKYKKGQSYMFVANHTSMTDIMLMLYVIKNPFVFVGKKELVKIPLFGFFYKKTCILVDRTSPKSRLEVFERAQKKLDQGYGICIFPEGGIPPNESLVLDQFKDGAFRLAIEHKIPIAAMVFYDNKKRFPERFLSGTPGKMRAKTLNTIPTVGLKLENKRVLRNQTREIILKELMDSSV